MAEVVVQGTPLAKVPSEPTLPYRLRAGKKHVHNRRALTPGDTVEFTEPQAHAFRDKFDPVGKGFPARRGPGELTDADKVRQARIQAGLHPETGVPVDLRELGPDPALEAGKRASKEAAFNDAHKLGPDGNKDVAPEARLKAEQDAATAAKAKEDAAAKAKA